MYPGNLQKNPYFNKNIIFQGEYLSEKKLLEQLKQKLIEKKKLNVDCKEEKVLQSHLEKKIKEKHTVLNKIVSSQNSEGKPDGEKVDLKELLYNQNAGFDNIKAQSFAYAKPGKTFSFNKFKLGFGIKLLEMINSMNLTSKTISGEKTYDFYNKEGFNDFFFLFGTDSIKTIHYYDFQKEAFFKRNFMKCNFPQFCCSASCTLPNGEIVISGGVNHDNYIVSQCTLLYNPMKNWTYVLKDMPKPRCHHQPVYHKAAVYSFGGKLINDTR